MPVDLTIVESTTELGQTVVEVVLESASAPGPAGPGVPTGGTDGQVLTKTSATDYATAWEDPTGGGGGAPVDATYLVTTADGTLSAEVVVGATPGGELGGTWASPTVDASHSGSTHAAVQAAAEATAAAALSAHLTDTSDAHDASAISSVAAGNLAATDVQAALNELDSEKAATSHAHAGEDITSGTVADARIASTIARDSEVPSNATFNDHSARHEDGGADEISIAGLDGTPTELTNHLNDASDAHDASAISVVDAGGLLASTEVEAALQELAGATGCRARRSGDYTHNSTGNWLVVPLNAEDYDSDGFHDNVTNNSRITIPSGMGGLYVVTGGINWVTNATGQRNIALLKNGATNLGSVSQAPNASFQISQAIATIAILAPTDYVELQAFQSSGGNLNTSEAGGTTSLCVFRIGVG